jgi:hypothetical protein
VHLIDYNLKNYLLPIVDDLLISLADTTHFSSINIKSGYYQIEVADKDVYKTAMRTQHGSHEFLAM